MKIFAVNVPGMIIMVVWSFLYVAYLMNKAIFWTLPMAIVRAIRKHHMIARLLRRYEQPEDTSWWYKYEPIDGNR